MIYRTLHAAALVAAAFLFSGCAFPPQALAQGAVLQSGLVTQGNASCWAQNGIIYDCGPTATPTTPGGTSGQVQVNRSGAFGGVTVGGDGTLNTTSGSLTVTKTGGVGFTALATATPTATGDLSGNWPNLTVQSVQGDAINLGGALTTASSFATVGNHPITFTTTGTTSLTLPTSGTLLTAFPSILNGQVLGNISGITGPAVGVPISLITTGLSVFTPTNIGVAPASGGGTANFLRADGTWVAPPGGGSVTSVTAGRCESVSPGFTGGTFTTTGSLNGVFPYEQQLATSYVVVDTDQCKLLDIQSSSTSMTAALPTAGAAGQFLAGWSSFILNDDQVFGQITPSGSTVNGASAVTLSAGQWALVESDGSAYHALFGSPWLTQLNAFNSIISGPSADARTNYGAQVFSGTNLGGAGSTTKLGRSQVEDYVFVNTTSGAGSVRLTTDGNSAGAHNVAALGNNSAVDFTAHCIISDTTTPAIWVYSLADSILSQAASASTTTFTINGGGVVAGPTQSSPASLVVAPTFAADVTNGGLNIHYTPPSGNTDTIYSACSIHFTTLRYN